MRPLRSFAGGRSSSGMRSSTARTRGSSWGPPPAAARPEPARSWRRFAKSSGQRGLGRPQLIEVGCLGMCYAEPIVSIAKPGRPLICLRRGDLPTGGGIGRSLSARRRSLPAYALGTLGDGSVAGIPNLLQTPVFQASGPPHPAKLRLDRSGPHRPLPGQRRLLRVGAHSLEFGREIIEELERAGLRGRGGAGFPTWRNGSFANSLRRRKIPGLQRR